MDNQEILLKKIRTQLASTHSINEEIASILNISYDAAHRRVSGKSKFSIDETVALAHHFNFSLDEIFFKQDKIIVEKTIEIQTKNFSPKNKYVAKVWLNGQLLDHWWFKHNEIVNGGTLLFEMAENPTLK